MPQLMNCPSCKKAISVPDGAAGKQMKCPKCHKPFQVPGLAGAGAGKVAAGAMKAAAGASKPAAGGSAAGTMEVDLPSIPSAAAGGGQCPACQAPMLPGAISCMDCGYMAATDAGGAADEDVLICANPQCGAANPKGEKNCIRCSQILPPPPGTIVHNRYKIEKQLAVGGFGAVYLAVDQKSSKQVAIKDMICEDPGEFAIRLNFFRREAEILRSLESVPIVPRIHDLIEKGDTAHLIMDFIRGKDLLKIMEGANNKPFPVEQVVEWSKSICDVLTVMHGMQPPLVHRDLKPDNIMLLEDQKNIKMIDFGTARDIGKTAKERAQGKTRVYTEGYAPPEQIIGKPEPRSDLFALAATMFHLVTGKSPEGTVTTDEITKELAKGSACAYPPKHRWFYELIKINMAEDLNDRYFSAKEVKADLAKQQVSKETSCGKCKAKNEVRKPYCGKCAAPLTDATVFCNQCGKNNVLGSRFCIYCGNRLR